MCAQLFSDNRLTDPGNSAFTGPPAIPRSGPAPLVRTYPAGGVDVPPSCAYKAYVSRPVPAAPRSLYSTLSQPLIDDGLTHASSVMPVVRSSLVTALSGTLIVSPPSNDTARPNLPIATRVGAAAPAPNVPLIGPADESIAVVPASSSKPKAATRPVPGPPETVRATVEPKTALTSAAGFWVSTVPAGAALATVVLVTTKPRLCRDAVAPASVEPTTFGTCTSTGPSETTIPTVLPMVAWVLPAGFWLITRPARTAGSLANATTTRNWAFVRFCVAVACVWPTTFGTLRVALGTGELIVWSANCSRSMLNSVSVPSVPTLSVTVTRPLAESIV